jgi:hypothetical protein
MIAALSKAILHSVIDLDIGLRLLIVLEVRTTSGALAENKDSKGSDKPIVVTLRQAGRVLIVPSDPCSISSMPSAEFQGPF